MQRVSCGRALTLVFVSGGRGVLEFTGSLKSLYALVVALAIAGGLLAVPSIAYARTVDAVTVDIKTDASFLPSPRVAEKMALSIEAVSQQILLGRSVDEVAQNKESYERLVKEIFDRVLAGYSISRVTIFPMETSHIDVVLTPWNDVVGNVAVELDVGSLPPQIAALIEADAGDPASKIGDILIGLPVEAVEWAGVMTKSVLREYLAERLPEFRANFDITGGQNTVVKISLIPNGAVVKNVNVTTVSKTIPNVVVSGFKPQMKEITESMIGLPVAFVERHQDYFAGGAKKNLDNNYYVKKYGLLTATTLTAGVVSEIEIGVETTQYVINIEGYLDIGRADNKDNTSVMVHLGKVFGSKDRNEVFAEMKFVPGTVSFDFESGIGRKITRSSSFEFRYNLSERDVRLRLIQQIHPKYSIRIQRRLSDGQNAFSLRYKVHEMLSAEYIFTNNEHWLRLIGHL